MKILLQIHHGWPEIMHPSGTVNPFVGCLPFVALLKHGVLWRRICNTLIQCCTAACPHHPSFMVRFVDMSQVWLSQLRCA